MTKTTKSQRPSPFFRASRIHRWIFALWCTATLTKVSDCLAQNYERGRQLYENHCQACHSTLLHSGAKGRVKSLEELKSQVSSWSIHAAKDWSAEEVMDVTLYLNSSFYHFKPR
jgi:mono/diheme cytochrome c family protein